MDQATSVIVEVERDHLPHALVVRVCGELDFGTTPALLDAVKDEPPAGASVILVLDELRFCDSSALGAMIALRQGAVNGGGALYLTGVQPQVLAAITVTSLDQLFLIRDTLAGALREISPR